ncbi:murein biosynthesis integral membrane protein MurJ [Microbacterium sp. SLBN-146]|uniref:murein biosynthesis integral membrane protein MurJ n=1 Tax=Microbacterium sp. SLBN-146 TaxID=2768457 RepID=UPI00114F9B9A|nr:murein biosynthesis integral membrane protein MurJ [Microbacterium sp. SLBN-146]TQJ30468.1 putative peptidoglycan lipid II flippase [Microbacterium sp. SLBN-146]
MRSAGSLLRGGVHLGSGTVASRVLGFLRTVLLAWILGAVGSEAADAFAVANQLPNNVYWLISSGVFAAILVPQVVRSHTHPDGGEAHINRVLTLGLSLLAVTTVVALLLAPWLVRIYTASWGSAQLELAVAFAVWCLPQILFYGVFSLLGEVLNARRQFAPAAWAPLINNVISLAGLGTFAIIFGVFPDGTGNVGDWTPLMVALLAGTTTLGVAGQAGVLVVAWRRARLRFRPDFRWREVHLSGMPQIAGWTFAIVVLGQVLGIVQSRVTALASGAGASLFATSTAWLLFMLPYSVVAVSITTVYFTRLSELGASGNTHEFVQLITSGTRMLVIAMTGATLAMLLVSVPIGRVLTEGRDSVQAMSMVLAAYLVGLVPFALLLLVQRAFYAVGDARTPFIYACVQAVVLVTATLLVPLLVRPEMIAAGVALAQSIGTTVQATAGYLLLRRKLGPLALRSLMHTAARVAVATLPASALGGTLGIWLVGPSLEGWAMTNQLTAAATAVLIATTFAATYLTMLWLVKDPTLQELITRFTPPRTR